VWLRKGIRYKGIRKEGICRKDGLNRSETTDFNSFTASSGANFLRAEDIFRNRTTGVITFDSTRLELTRSQTEFTPSRIMSILRW
jgi:hypothetical protein